MISLAMLTPLHNAFSLQVKQTNHYIIKARCNEIAIICIIYIIKNLLIYIKIII